MPDLKLAKLPDRTPVKHTIIVTPELDKKLRDYADLYLQEYGVPETIETLIPFMLNAFLESDRSFVKASKNKIPDKRMGDASSDRHRSRPTGLNAKISSQT